jgi:hypothetical protein
MKAINAMADRLLSAVVPRITAGACCPPDTTFQLCYCYYPGYGLYRYCSYNCACQITCGGCNTVRLTEGC